MVAQSLQDLLRKSPVHRPQNARPVSSRTPRIVDVNLAGEATGSATARQLEDLVTGASTPRIPRTVSPEHDPEGPDHTLEEPVDVQSDHYSESFDLFHDHLAFRIESGIDESDASLQS